MKLLPSTPPFVRRALLAVSLATIAATAAHALTEEYELRSGLRIPAESVKLGAGGTFNATVDGKPRTFKAAEIARATLREPAELAEGRDLIATDKPLAAIALLTRMEEELKPYREVRGAWWSRAVILRMDALASKGDAKAAVKLANADMLDGLPPETASELTEFKSIIEPSDKADAKITTLKGMAKRATEPWMAARIWIEIGNTHSDNGQIEEAIKAWLRVVVFHPAERDLAARGTILAARALQQLERPQDGEQLIKDYLTDHPTSPYETALKAEAEKLKPKKKTDDPTEEAPKTDDPAPENSN